MPGSALRPCLVVVQVAVCVRRPAAGRTPDEAVLPRPGLQVRRRLDPTDVGEPPIPPASVGPGQGCGMNDARAGRHRHLSGTGRCPHRAVGAARPITPLVVARDVSRVPDAGCALAGPAPGALPTNDSSAGRCGMGARVREGKALVYVDVGVQADVEITLVMDRDGGEGAAIQFGLDGPDVIMEFVDVDSLERLAAVAAEGARQLRDRITTNDRAAAPASDGDLLVGAGADQWV
jgi:hypothetical protein